MIDYKDIFEIHETTDERAINQLLSKGWVLLNSYTKASNEFETKDLEMIYSLGRPSSVEYTTKQAYDDTCRYKNFSSI